MEKLIAFTNAKILNWYTNAKNDYGVIGSGLVRFTNDSVIVELKCVEYLTDIQKIKHRENGEKKEWSMAFYHEYFKEQKIDWVFNCWSELA